jgi:DNA repair exonuclease SbcCD nuclease subunit
LTSLSIQEAASFLKNPNLYSKYIMTKLAIVADVHLGYAGRNDDILWALRTVRSYCQNNDIDTVVVLGDLFHDRQHLSIEVLCAAYDFFREAKYDYEQHWIAFPGNHDMFLKHSWSINSIKPLGELLTIIETVKILEIEDRRYWVLPFVHSESAYMRILKRIEEQWKKDDILLTHVGVNNAIQNVCFLLQRWSIVTFIQSKFDRVYAGHFHLQQQVLNNLWYPGSLIPFKFDEGDCDHGFFVFDQDANNHEFINVLSTGRELQPDIIPPPQFCTFAEEFLDSKTEADVAGNIIRIATTRDYSPNECQDLRDHFSTMGAKKVTFINLSDDEAKHDKLQEFEPIRIEDLFTKWYDQDERGTKGLRRNLAIKLNREIVSDGNELYSKRIDPDAL